VRKRWGSAAIVAVVLASVATPLEAARPSRPSLHQLAQLPIEMNNGRTSFGTGTTGAAGSDLAFQKDLLIAGAWEGIGFFRILNRAPYLEQLSFFDCPGAQGDVSVWGNFVFVSIEHQSSYGLTPNTGVSDTCNPSAPGLGMEGIRIIDISDPRRPRQVKFIPLLCGSHTHTLIPDGKRLYLYNSALAASYAGDSVPYCARLTIIEMPPNDPTQARVVAEPGMDLVEGCHDITAFPDEGVALGACWNDSWLWDITEPADPKILSKLPSDWVDGHHAAAFTWDGEYAAVGQEAGDCTSQEGEIVFYDIRDRRAPKRVGRFHLPRSVVGSFCWAHNFSVVPTKDRTRYVLTAGFYNGGTTVVDFSNPRSPEEIAFAADTRGRLPQPWGAYWYNGRIYSNDWNSGFGVTVYEMDGLGAREGLHFKPRLNPQLQIRP
jgi:hypothetical protein